MEQRLKLKRCFQNEKKVSAYVHELEELYNMIGTVDERCKGNRWRDWPKAQYASWGSLVNILKII